MTSAAQVSANRFNAQKSTGPRSAEGKAAVAQNAVRHGLLARAAVLQGEDAEEFAEYREQVLEDLHADGTLEVVLAERVVSLSWRLQRAARNQNAAFEVLYDKHTGAPQALLPEPAPGLDPGAPGGDGATIGRILVQDFAQEKVLERLLMYERRIESSLYRTIAQLEKRQRLRGAEPATDGGLIRSMGVPPMTVQDAHGQDARATHGRDAHATEPEGGTPSGGGDESCETNPSCPGSSGGGNPSESCETNPIDVGAKAGETPNAGEAQEQTCQTNPIGARANAGGAPNGVDAQGQLCETKPISRDPNAGQPAAGGVLRIRGAQTDSAKQDACDKSRNSGVRAAFPGQYRRLFRAVATFVGRVKQSQFAANCLPDHGLRAGGTLGTAIS